MEKKIIEYYNKARNSIIDMSSKDVTSIIALERSYVGVTRILICLEKLGISEGNCYMTALPDFTYTKHEDRWKAGFPYGCIFNIKSNNIPFVPLDLKPNCCGVIFAEIAPLNDDLYSLKKRLYDTISNYEKIDETDFKRGNHFIGIYEHLNKYYLLIHGSLDYVKSKLYNDRNEQLLKKVRKYNILGTDFCFFIDDEAELYYHEYLKCEKTTIQYRELLAKKMFPEANILFNMTHEGFFGINTILLGAYASNLPFSCPLMMSPGTDLSLINVTKPINISDKKIYCSPHGGGYAFCEVSGIKKVSINISSEYILTYPNGLELLSDDILRLPYYYRTNTDECWCKQHNMGSIVNKFRPLINLKI